VFCAPGSLSLFVALVPKSRFRDENSELSASGASTFSSQRSAKPFHAYKVLRQLRSLSGLSVRETARRAGINVTRLTFFENNLCELRDAQVASLARVLRCAIQSHAKRVAHAIQEEKRHRYWRKADLEVEAQQ
jgi:hypothetical protein